jgi:hypothetical protein
MKIQYTDGTSRTTSNNPDTINACLQQDLGDHVIYGGLVWTADAAERHPDDDGQHAAAKLWNDDGTEATDYDGQ